MQTHKEPKPAFLCAFHSKWCHHHVLVNKQFKFESIVRCKHTECVCMVNFFMLKLQSSNCFFFTFLNFKRICFDEIMSKGSSFVINTQQQQQQQIIKFRNRYWIVYSTSWRINIRNSVEFYFKITFFPLVFMPASLNDDYFINSGW